MVFVAAPETAAWVAFAESGVRLEHPPGAVGFEHGLSGLDGVPFGDVDGEVDVASAVAEVAEFEPEAFELPERLGARVDARLFLEAVVVAFGFEHHGHPVVAGVTRKLFRATARYVNLHKLFSPVAPVQGAGGTPARARQKQRNECVE